MKSRQTTLIPPETAVTLDGLFHERARRFPNSTAYQYFDHHLCDWRELTWGQVLQDIARWQAALIHEGFQPGDRVAIMLKNCPQWVIFDLAALGLGLVTVPLYVSDRPENVAHVLQDSGARLLLIDSAEHWHPLHEACSQISTLTRVVTLKSPPEGDDDARLRSVDEWLPEAGGEFRHLVNAPDALATIIYTSGTTGKSKGVMLSHRNLLSNAWQALQTFDVYPDDIFLSFLPLSHCLERMGGYIVPIMAGATVAYARSAQQLQEDLARIRPTVLVTVPRIFERLQTSLRNKLDKGPAYARHLFALAVEVGYSRFEHAQGRAPWQRRHLLWPLLKHAVAEKLAERLGGRLRLAVSGGAALSAENARTFIGLGITIIQGYGLTEASPVISVNRIEDNHPTTVGNALPGVEVRLGSQDVLEVRGPNVMLGYWNNETATRTMFTTDGWLNTGDVARIDEYGHITITDRIKEIIVLNNGEKVPPTDIEAAILSDPLFEQVMLVGEGKPFLSLLAVVNRERWEEAAHERDLPDIWPGGLQLQQARAFALSRVAHQMKAFPGYARIRRIVLLAELWSLDNGLLTPTLKIKRSKVLERFVHEYENLYEGYLQ
ncbi:MAG TPA: long-chain fatty acid--CoA ligase [Methylophilaceae bacterium]|nr:long-chain fatty acid--CoA ligase [Methylophilaceae bacterium]